MAVVTTNLETQVQARIDGLTGSETLEDLLLLSKATEGLGVNRASLDTAIETKISALNASSPLPDLLLAGKAAGLVPVSTPASIIKSVQRGSASIAGNDTTVDITISQVDLSKAVCHTYARIGSTNVNASVATFTAQLTSEVNLKVSRGSFVGTVTSIEWQVIEYV